MERRGVIVTVVIPKNSQAIGALTSIQALIDSSPRRFHKAKKAIWPQKNKQKSKNYRKVFSKKVKNV